MRARRSGEVPIKFILGSIPNGAGTTVLWFLWSLIVAAGQGVNPSRASIIKFELQLATPTGAT